MVYILQAMIASKKDEWLKAQENVIDEQNEGAEADDFSLTYASGFNVPGSDEVRSKTGISVQKTVKNKYRKKPVVPQRKSLRCANISKHNCSHNASDSRDVNSSITISRRSSISIRKREMSVGSPKYMKSVAPPRSNQCLNHKMLIKKRKMGRKSLKMVADVTDGSDEDESLNQSLTRLKIKRERACSISHSQFFDRVNDDIPCSSNIKHFSVLPTTQKLNIAAAVATHPMPSSSISHTSNSVDRYHLPGQKFSLNASSLMAYTNDFIIHNAVGSRRLFLATSPVIKNNPTVVRLARSNIARSCGSGINLVPNNSELARRRVILIRRHINQAPLLEPSIIQIPKQSGVDEGNINSVNNQDNTFPHMRSENLPFNRARPVSTSRPSLGDYERPRLFFRKQRLVNDDEKQSYNMKCDI